jgi:hypothetical protein
VRAVWRLQIGHAYKQRKKMKRVIRAQEADFDFVLHVNS